MVSESKGVKSAEETLFESGDSRACWKMASEVLLATESPMSDAVSVMLRAAELVFESLGRYPSEMYFVCGRGLVVWRIGHRDLVLETDWSGAALWTLSQGAGFGYRDRDGAGLGKSFHECLLEIRSALERSLS